MEKKIRKNIFDQIALVLFIFSVICFIFCVGVFVGGKRIFPYHILKNMENAVLIAVGMDKDTVTRYHYLSDAWYNYSGVRINDANSMMKGVTLLTSYWSSLDWKSGIQLIDSTGRILHRWKVDPAKIWPKSPYTDHVRNRKNTSYNYIHGCYLFDNGDVLFNIEYMGLVRMNASGEVLWTLPGYRTHHSISRDQDGNFWVCGLKWIEDTPEGRARLADYPGLRLPVGEDFALKVSEDGKILREISILKVLYQNGYKQFIRQSSKRTDDILHTNDVETLHSDMANQYPLFNAGDILISCRFLNAVFVIDKETEKIKWYCNRFLQQHDPDFLKNGWISVFDNNNDGTENGYYPGGSRIVAVKPGRDEIRIFYPKTKEQEFYTSYGGKVQYLANGNMLITEAWRGRVFETDPSGRTVWEWVQERYNENLVPEVLEGTRYPFTPEQIAGWESNSP